MDGGNDPPQFAQVGQNITAAAMLLCGCPKEISEGVLSEKEA